MYVCVCIYIYTEIIQSKIIIGVTIFLNFNKVYDMILDQHLYIYIHNYHLFFLIFEARLPLSLSYDRLYKYSTKTIMSLISYFPSLLIVIQLFAYYYCYFLASTTY